MQGTGALKRWGARALGWAGLGAGLDAGRWARGRVAGGWARRAGAGSGTARALQATSARACGAGGSRRAGPAAGRAQALGARRASGRRAAWALGTRPGRAGWPWAVHSVHSAHFRSVLTRFFFLSHQMNTVHCKIKIFWKKK